MTVAAVAGRSTAKPSDAATREREESAADEGTDRTGMGRPLSAEGRVVEGEVEERRQAHEAATEDEGRAAVACAHHCTAAIYHLARGWPSGYEGGWQGAAEDQIAPAQ